MPRRIAGTVLLLVVVWCSWWRYSTLALPFGLLPDSGLQPEAGTVQVPTQAGKYSVNWDPFS